MGHGIENLYSKQDENIATHNLQRSDGQVNTQLQLIGSRFIKIIVPLQTKIILSETTKEFPQDTLPWGKSQACQCVSSQSFCQGNTYFLPHWPRIITCARLQPRISPSGPVRMRNQATGWEVEALRGHALPQLLTGTQALFFRRVSRVGIVVS